MIAPDRRRTEATPRRPAPPGAGTPRYEHDLLTTEVEALRLVRERTDLPVPEVLAWDRACDLLPTPYFLMTGA